MPLTKKIQKNYHSSLAISSMGKFEVRSKSPDRFRDERRQGKMNRFPGQDGRLDGN